MSRHGKRDILVHFDEEKDELILYTVGVGDTKYIREREFDGARLNIPFLLEKSADEAEKSLGEMVFSLIDTFSLKKTGIRPYEALIGESHRLQVAEWKADAEKGDAEAQYMLFIEYHSRALFGCDPESLRKAEEMLEASVAQGYQRAIESKERWPLMRAAVEKKLKRGPVA